MTITIGIRLVSRARLSRSQSSKPLDVLEHQVQEDQVGLLLGDGLESFRTRENLDRLETTRLHQTGQNVVGVALIIDDQNGARHGQNSKSLRESDGAAVREAIAENSSKHSRAPSQAWQGFARTE